MTEKEIKACLDALSEDERTKFEFELKKRADTIKILQSAEKVMCDLKSVAEWFADHGKNTNMAVISVAENAVKLIEAQRIELVCIANEQSALINDFARKIIERIESAPINHESTDYVDGAVWMQDAIIDIIDEMAVCL